jgi:hypothetical protein
MDWFYQCVWPADQSGDVGIRRTLLSNKPLPSMSCRGLLVAFFRLYLKRGDFGLTRHAFSEEMRGKQRQLCGSPAETIFSSRMGFAREG